MNPVVGQPLPTQTEVTIDAGNPAISIEVIDAGYNVRAQAYGKIVEKFPTGLYTIRYTAADAKMEQDIIVRPNLPLMIDEVPELKFASAAPIEWTWTSHEYHQAHANRLSISNPTLLGKGGELFVFVRDLNVGDSRNPTQGLTLHRLGGDMIVKFDEVVEVNTDGREARWAGCNLALDPGTYRLRHSYGSGQAIEIAITVCPGWQNQIFILRQQSSNQSSEENLLDLGGAAQLMVRAGRGFDAHHIFTRGPIRAEWAGEDLRLAELARQALAHGQKIISQDDLRTMLKGKWDDPLLGIFGLHLLFMQPAVDLDFARQIVERLRHILDHFPHPDVESIAFGISNYGGSTAIYPTDAPPMLLRSWQMRLQASISHPNAITPGSFASQIAGSLWGSGAWLSWEVPRDGSSNVEFTLENNSYGFMDAAESFSVGGDTHDQIDEDDLQLVMSEIVRVLLELNQTVSEPMDFVTIAQEAGLDESEFAICAQIALPSLVMRRNYFQEGSSTLTLSTLVQRLMLPAWLIPSKMMSAFVKLVELLPPEKREQRV